MCLMLQADEPDTFVLATGKTTEIRDFVNFAFDCTGRQLGGRVKEIMNKDSMLKRVNY